MSAPNNSEDRARAATFERMVKLARRARGAVLCSEFVERWCAKDAAAWRALHPGKQPYEIR